MTPGGELTGAVLAGGQSRRMGRDKAMLSVDGDPLWLRQVRVLRAAGATTVGVVRRHDQAALDLSRWERAGSRPAAGAGQPGPTAIAPTGSRPPPVELWFDAASDVGPLAGLDAALTACRTEQLAVLAVDMPGIDAGWFRWLRESCRAGAGAITQHPDGTFEALAAIYPLAAAPPAAQCLRNGSYALQGLAAQLVAAELLVPVPLAASEAWRVASWNSPADAAPA